MATDGALTKPLFSVCPSSGRRRFHLWLVCVSAVVSIFLVEIYLPEVRILPEFMASVGADTLLAVFLIALWSEYIDASLGGGFGTIFSPILGSSVFLGLTFGFDNYVPCLLISEFFAGIWAGFMHNRDGNVDWRGDRGSQDGILLSMMSIVGGVGAVYVKGIDRGSVRSGGGEPKSRALSAGSSSFGDHHVGDDSPPVPLPPGAHRRPGDRHVQQGVQRRRLRTVGHLGPGRLGPVAQAGGRLHRHGRCAMTSFVGVIVYLGSAAT